MTFSQALHGILNNLCPHCGRGKVFARLIYGMNERCPSCGVKFERESGYFLGSMVFTYIFSAFSVVPTLVLLGFVWQMSLVPLIVIPSIQVTLLNPFLVRYSRLVWLYVDHRADPGV